MIGAEERAFARALVALVLGVDRIYLSRLPEDATGLRGEGYVAINLSEVPPLAVTSYAEAGSASQELLARLDRIDLAPDRRTYFTDYLQSIEAFLAWQSGDPPAYPELVSRLLGVQGTPPALEPLLEGLGPLLEEAGHSGELADMLRAFEASRIVPQRDVGPLLERYLEEARAVVDARLLPLPKDFSFAVEVVSGAPYNAYCDYVGRVVRINGDVPHTNEGLKHLACHEAYPGHSTHILRREQLVHAGEMTEDGLLVVTDTPTSPLFEGIGEVGLRLVGWDRTLEERIALAIMRLRSALGAWAGSLTAKGRTADASELLLRYGDSAWMRSRLRFLDMPLRRPFIFAYHFGDLAVEAARAKATDDRTFLAGLYDRMHSPASLHHMFSDLEGGI